jgi:DNA mismatch endonuclease (patch repair protein)
MSGGWNGSRPPERAWRRAGNKLPPSQEQDLAAGGRGERLVSLADGRTALGSIVLRVYPKTRRIRAALRWSQDGRSPERYLGEVQRDSRAANLAEGWRLARASGLLAEEKPAVEGITGPRGSADPGRSLRSAKQR